MISLGYETTNDRDQITFGAAKMLIAKLAQLHATSILLDKQNNDTVAQLSEVYFDFHMDKSYCDDMDKCIEMMKSFVGFENIVGKLEGTTEEMFDKVRGLYYGQSDAACKVLCHGDMKSANTLIKKRGSHIENGVFVRNEFSILE